MFIGPGEDFAIGEIAITGAVDPRASTHVVVEIGARPHNVDVVGHLQAIDDACLLVTLALPGRHRVGLVEFAGCKDEFRIITERHVGFLGLRRGGEEGQAPTKRAIGAPLHHALGDGAHSGAALGDPGCVDATQGTRVFIGHNREVQIDGLDFVTCQRGHVGELVIIGVGEEDFVEPVHGQSEQRIGARLHGRPVDRFDEGCGRVGRHNAKELARFSGQ